MPTSNRLVLFVAIQLVVITALIWGWTLYWSSAAARIESEADRAIDRLRADGIEVACAARRMEGYPLRFRFTCDGMTLRAEDQSRRFTLSIPTLTATALALAPARQRIKSTGSIGFGMKRLRGDADGEAPDRISLRFETASLGLDLDVAASGLKALSLETTGIDAVLTGYRGERATFISKIRAGEVAVYASQANKTGDGDSGGGHEFEVAAAGLSHQTSPPPHPILESVRIEQGLIAATVHDMSRLTLSQIMIDGEPLSLDGDGMLSLGPDGEVEGKVITRTDGIAPLLGKLVETGDLRAESATLILTAATLLSATGGRPGTITLPLRFTAKGIYYGPVRIAEPLRLTWPELRQR